MAHQQHSTLHIEPLPAMSMVPAPRRARLLMRVLRMMVLVIPVVLACTPWQQTVHGYGRVVALDPTLRERRIAAPIEGRVVKVNVVENQFVRAGDVIVEMEDVFAGLQENYQRQYSAAKEKLKLSKDKAKSYETVVKAFEDVLKETDEAVALKIESAKEKVIASQEKKSAREAEELQSRLDLQRRRETAAEGIDSKFTLEQAERKYQVEKNGLDEAKANVRAAQAELESDKKERVSKYRENEGKIDKAKAELQEALGQVQLAEKELLDAEVKLNKQQQQVLAPIDGRVQRVLANPGTEVLYKGSELVTIVPETDELAVELLVSGNDASLIEAGRPVRLQFEGWPAVQFAGWPSVAIGTFGGTVSSVDSLADSKGRFRILVKPDVREGDRIHPAWPKNRRQGVRTNGWVLLNQVSLGWELWRLSNGFQPVLSDEDPSKGQKDASELKENKELKKPKVPK